MTAEGLARKFHETYEKMAPVYGHAPRPEFAVPWDELAEGNRRLLTAVFSELWSDFNS